MKNEEPPKISYSLGVTEPLGAVESEAVYFSLFSADGIPNATPGLGPFAFLSSPWDTIHWQKRYPREGVAIIESSSDVTG